MSCFVKSLRKSLNVARTDEPKSFDGPISQGTDLIPDSLSGQNPVRPRFVFESVPTREMDRRRIVVELESGPRPAN